MVVLLSKGNRTKGEVTMKSECRLCSTETDTKNLTALDLYAFGSESELVCNECRRILAEVARTMRSMCTHSFMRGYKKAKANCERNSDHGTQ